MAAVQGIVNTPSKYLGVDFLRQVQIDNCISEGGLEYREEDIEELLAQKLERKAEEACNTWFDYDEPTENKSDSLIDFLEDELNQDLRAFEREQIKNYLNAKKVNFPVDSVLRPYYFIIIGKQTKELRKWKKCKCFTGKKKMVLTKFAKDPPDHVSTVMNYPGGIFVPLNVNKILSPSSISQLKRGCNELLN